MKEAIRTAAGRRRHFLRSQLHGNLTPAHADGCGAQCFAGVQCASIFDPARVSSPASCHACFATRCRSLIRLVVVPSCGLATDFMANRPYGSAQTGMYPSALYCAGGLPPGFLFQSAASAQGKRKQGKGKLSPLPGQFGQFMLTIEWMSLISSRRFMYSSTRIRGWPSGS